MEQVENLENVTENHEPENEAVPEENRVVDIAVETPPVSPESVQVETNSNSTEKKGNFSKNLIGFLILKKLDSEINSKNLISNSASSSYFSGVFSLLSIVSLLL